MYQISPDKAMTELYGVQKGEAQVFDTSIAERALQNRLNRQEADKLAKQKAAQEARKKTSDLLNNKVGVVHPSDQPVFTKMQDQYAKNVLDAYKKGGGNLSIEDEAALNQQFNTMNQNALQSKGRFEAERKHLDEMDNPNNPFREREKTRAHTGFAQSSFGENGSDFTPKTGASQVYDIEKNVVNPLASQVKSQVESNKVYGKTGIPFEASVSHAENLVKNAQVARELHEKALDLKDEGQFDSFVQNLYGSPKDEYGNKNPAYISDLKKREEVVQNTTPENIKLDDMSKYLYTNRFVFKGQDYAPFQYSSASQAKTAPVPLYNPNANELTMTDAGAKTTPRTVSYGGKSHNALSVKLDVTPDGKIGENNTITIIPTKYQAAEDARAKKYERDKDIYISKELNKLLLDPNDPAQQEDYEREKERIESNYPKYEVDPEIVETIKVKDPNQAESYFKQRYPGQNIRELLKTENVVESEKAPQEEGRYVNGVWVPGKSAVKEKAKTYDISGKSYSHDDLIKAGYSEKQINDAIKAGKIK